MLKGCRPFVAMLTLILVGNAAATPSMRKPWFEVKTEHFTVYSNLDDDDALDLAQQLETFRLALDRVTRGTTSSPLPTVVLACRRAKDIKPYTRSQSVGGVFFESPEANLMILDASSGYEDLSTVFHEYFHFWRRLNMQRLPLWVEEGMAEFYSTFQVNGTTLELGRPIDNHVLALRFFPPYPLDILVNMDPGNPLANGEGHTGSFYSQSWALIHYFMVTSSETREQLREYIAAVTNGQDAEKAFLKAFNTKPTWISQEIKDYVANDKLTFLRYDIGNYLRGNKPDIAPADPVDIYRWFGLVSRYTHGPQDQFTVEHFKKAVEESPKNPVSNALLARAISGDEPEKAGECVTQALNQGSKDSATQWLLGKMHQEDLHWTCESFGDSLCKGDSTQYRQKARRHFQKALGDSAQYLCLVEAGYTYLPFEADSKDGVDYLTRAWNQSPTDVEVLSRLIALLCGSGQVDRAWEAFSILLSKGTDQQIDRAEEALARGEFGLIEDYLDTGDRAGALAHLQRIVLKTEDPQTREIVMAVGSAMLSSAEHRREAAEFAEYALFMHTRSVEVALKGLETLSPNLTNPDLLAATSTLIVEFDKEHREAEAKRLYYTALLAWQAKDLERTVQLLEQALEICPQGEFQDQLKGVLKKADKKTSLF